MSVVLTTRKMMMMKSDYFVDDGSVAGEWYVFDNDSCSCVAGPYDEERAIEELLRLQQLEKQ